VPFIDDDHAQARQCGLCVGAGEQQGQAFRGGDQRGRQASALTCAFSAAGVAGAQTDAPRNLQISDGRLQGTRGVGSEGAHRRDPQHGQRFGWRFAFFAVCDERLYTGEAVERGEPHRIGFTGAGAGVEQPGLTFFNGGPYLLLKGERLPVACVEPGFCEVGGGGHTGGVRSERVPSVTAPTGERFNHAAIPV